MSPSTAQSASRTCTGHCSRRRTRTASRQRLTHPASGTGNRQHPPPDLGQPPAPPGARHGQQGHQNRRQDQAPWAAVTAVSPVSGQPGTPSTTRWTTTAPARCCPTCAPGAAGTTPTAGSGPRWPPTRHGYAPGTFTGVGGAGPRHGRRRLRGSTSGWNLRSRPQRSDRITGTATPAGQPSDPGRPCRQSFAGIRLAAPATARRR